MFVAVVMASEINRATHGQHEGIHRVFYSIKQVSAALGQRFGLMSRGLTRLHLVDLLCDTVVLSRTPSRLKELFTLGSHLLIMTHLQHHCGLKLYCLTIIEQFENVSLATSICLFTNWMFEQTGFLLTV